ncbi:hypothetical protein Ancab_032085 [Ancistrocladus abbreviatus]
MAILWLNSNRELATEFSKRQQPCVQHCQWPGKWLNPNLRPQYLETEAGINEGLQNLSVSEWDSDKVVDFREGGGVAAAFPPTSGRYDDWVWIRPSPTEEPSGFPNAKAHTKKRVNHWRRELMGGTLLWISLQGHA